MTKEQAKKLLSDNPTSNPFDFEGTCHDCTKPITVSIIRDDSEDGFYVDGGAIYQEDEIYLKCPQCYDADKTLRYFRKTEIFSRVVGYLRPVKNWNPGKAAEFKDRKMFRMSDNV